jgi:hypothetical protein
MSEVQLLLRYLLPMLDTHTASSASAIPMAGYNPGIFFVSKYTMIGSAMTTDATDATLTIHMSPSFFNP